MGILFRKRPMTFAACRCEKRLLVGVRQLAPNPVIALKHGFVVSLEAPTGREILSRLHGLALQVDPGFSRPGLLAAGLLRPFDKARDRCRLRDHRATLGRRASAVMPRDPGPRLRSLTRGEVRALRAVIDSGPVTKKSRILPEIRPEGCRRSSSTAGRRARARSSLPDPLHPRPRSLGRWASLPLQPPPTAPVHSARGRLLPRALGTRAPGSHSAPPTTTMRRCSGRARR